MVSFIRFFPLDWDFYMIGKKINKIAFVFLSSLIASLPAFAADCVSGAQTTGSCTVPAGVSSMSLSITGGGGGGGGGTPNFGGGGGGGGGSCILTNFAVSPGQTLVITVGPAGIGGISDAMMANAGGFGAYSSVVYSGTTYQGNGGAPGAGAMDFSGEGSGGLGGGSICPGGLDPTGADGAPGILLVGGSGGSGGNLPAPGAAGGDGGDASQPGEAGLNGSVVLTFTAAPAPAPAAVPTLSEWAMILMASVMAMFGIRRMRRSK
jgi:hypothetical protein